MVSASNSVLGGEPVFSTKWAMDNDDYARLHSDPYSDDPVIRRSQRRREMSDARFQEDTYGVYVGGGGALNNWSVGEADVGMFMMPSSCSTVRFGAIGMVAGGKPMAGGELGVRLHTPTRLAPYVGLAGVLEMSGVERHTSSRRSNYYDNNGHRLGNSRWGYFPTGMAAIVPEAGVSYWLTSSTRLNLGVSYFVTSGRQPDFLQASLSMDFALRAPPEERLPAQFLERDYESGSQFIPGDQYFIPGAPVRRDVDEPTPDPIPDPIPDPPLGSLGLPPAQLDSRANSFPVMLSNPKVVFPSPAEALPPTLSMETFLSRCMAK